MVSRASVCQEGAGSLWRSHPRACPGPAQPPGSPQQDTGSPKTDSLSQAQPPRLPVLLGTSRWARSQPPSIRLYPWHGARGRRLVRDGAAGSRCPPCLCPSPPQVPSQGEAALVSRLRMVGGRRRASFPWQLSWSGALLGAHRTGRCSPQIQAVLSQGPRGAAGCWDPRAPRRVAGTVWASEGRRESSRSHGLTDGSSGTSGGVDRGRGGAGMQAGALGRWSQARSGTESGQSPGAERLQWRGAEGAPQPPPHPTLFPPGGEDPP